MSKNKKNRLPPGPVTAAPEPLSFGSRVFAWISLGWAVWILVLYWQRFSWMGNLPPAPRLASTPTQWIVFWLDAKALFLLATSVAGMTAGGSYLLRLFRIPWHTSLEETVFSMGMGMGATGTLIFGLGLLQLYRPPVFWGLWVAGLTLTWMRWFRSGALDALNDAALRLNQWHAEHRGWRIQRWLLGSVVLMACVMAFTPEIFYDAMAYHLGVPRWYLFEGGIKYYPSVTAQFPFLRQMLNLLGLALEGERLAKLLHASSVPLLIAIYHALAGRFSFPKTALIASLAFLSMPMVNMNAWTTGIDVGLSSFALLCFLAWLNGLQDPEMRNRWFTLAGVFGGFCFASKYPGLLIIAGLCVTTLFWLKMAEKDWGAAFRKSLLMGSVALGVTLPWLIKTGWMTGNPVYPYLSHWLGSRDLSLYRMKMFLSDTGAGGKTHLWDLLKTPWTGTLSEISSLAAPGVFLLGFLGFLLTGVFRKDLRHPGYSPAVLFFALYWFSINAMTGSIRLALPGLAIGCFLLAHTAGALYARSGGFVRFLIAGVVAFSTLWGLLSTIPTWYTSYAPWNVLAGKESPEDYLSYTHPGMNPYPSMRAFMHAKRVVPPGHRLLIVGDEKVSSSPVPFLATGAFNESLIVRWVRDAKTTDEVARAFKQNNVSHLLINVTEAQRLIQYKIINWDDRSLALLTAFFDRHMRLVYQDQIPERYFNHNGPLLLYAFIDPPPTTPPSDNMLLKIHAAYRARPDYGL